jgi:S1/P1 Nuclease
MRKLVIACLIQFALLTQAHAWGPEGHSIVAEIAQRRLSPEAAAKVREILGENASLASIASWADELSRASPRFRRLALCRYPACGSGL